MIAIAQNKTVPRNQLPITIYVSPEVKEALKEWAVEEKRPLSNLVKVLIEELVEDREKEKQAGQPGQPDQPNGK